MPNSSYDQGQYSLGAFLLSLWHLNCLPRWADRSKPLHLVRMLWTCEETFPFATAQGLYQRHQGPAVLGLRYAWRQRVHIRKYGRFALLDNLLCRRLARSLSPPRPTLTILL